NGPVILYIETHSEILSDKPSHNVVAEIKGSEFPDEIILVGGHLDSWDLAGGAHDDGAGCVHSMEVMNALKALNYTPKRTLRVVLFMNEENGLAGGREYARISKEKGEFHLAAMESDAGGFTPRGFSFDAEDEMFAGLYRQITALSPFLEPYNLHFSKGGSGADIGPLKNQKGLLIGFRPDSQRYFDFHHSAADNITAVNERELKLGAAAMTSLIYLIDKYGLEH
ncbi:MAG: M20/M25/M40 family metallo-hydrolase, partial [Saprospiraceae bacterium]|nr:M20/M25/M40 family metallo-hydrolase [Saprospiraceae bacterium]